MCAADSMSTTEFRNGKCEGLSGLNRHGTGGLIRWQPLRRALSFAPSDWRLVHG